jgi:hypothetical protein
MSRYNERKRKLDRITNPKTAKALGITNPPRIEAGDIKRRKR